MRAALKVAAINCCLAVTVAFFAELIFGSWVHGGHLNHLNIPKNVDVDYTYQLPGGTGWTSNYRRDRFGLRGDYEALDEIDILTLGGSTTDQRFLSENKTWQGVLRKEFIVVR